MPYNAHMQTIAEELSKIISGDVSIDSNSIAAHSRDKSPIRITPRIVVFPKNVADIQSVVKLVSAHKQARNELSITARAGGSDVGGGPLGESIILSLTKYFTNLSFTTGHARVQPGVFYRDFEKKSLEHNLLLPSYPASRSLCALGGMVANNAGGEKTLAFGKTDSYVDALEIVLDDGSLAEIKKLSREELAEKCALSNREGEIYREISSLVKQNYDTLLGAKPHVSKNSAGYALWNVWDPHTDTFDLTKLFVGSQGTLGIITDISLRLITPQPLSQMLAIFVDDLDQIPRVVKTVLAHKPEAFEVYDKTVLSIIFTSFFGFIKLMGSTIFKLAIDFIPEFKIILSKRKIPDYILTAEFTGNNPDEIQKRVSIVATELRALGIATHMTRGDREIKKYHTIRRESFSLLQKHHKNRQTITFFDDLIVLPEKLPQFIPALRAILDSYPSVAYSIFGHIGDGNFHIIPLMDLTDPRSRETIENLTREINALVLSFQGSITAEHNDGLVRSPFLKQMYGDDVYALFEKTKQIFDPKNIFNPGKKVHARLSYALDHMSATLGK